MTSANREALGYIVEVTDNVFPSTPTGQLLNFTGVTFGSENSTTESKTVRSDTNRQGTVRTGRTVAGDISFELQYGALDGLLEGVFRSTWSAALNVSATGVQFAASGNTITKTGAFGNAVVGQWVRIGGDPVSANRGFRRILTKTNDAITVSGATLVNETVAGTTTIKGAMLKNGTTTKSFSFERAWADISQFMQFSGVKADTFSLNVSTNQIVTGSIGLMGRTPDITSSTVWSATTAAASTVSYNSLDHLALILIDDTAVTNDLTGITFNMSTNASRREAIGEIDSAGIIQNSVSVSGTLTEYFTDDTLLTKNLDFDNFSLAFVLNDEDDNAYVIHMPYCVPKSGKPDNGGLDSQITIAHGFDATYDSTLGYTVSISRIPA